jgi:hypothetical protein
MTLKTASLLALVGTGLLAILLAAHFILDLTNAASGLIPAIQVLTSFIHALAGVSVAVFFYVFHSRLIPSVADLKLPPQIGGLPNQFAGLQ